MSISIVKQPEAIVFVGNQVIVQLDTSLLGTVENLNIRCNTYIEFKDGSNSSHNSYEKVDADTHFTFRLGALLQSMLGDNVGVPSGNAVIETGAGLTTYLATKMPAYVELYFEELYENGTTGGNETISFYLMRGGVAFDKSGFSDFWEYFLFTFDDEWNIPFLSWKPNYSTIIDPSMPEILTYYNLTHEDIFFNINIFDKDHLQIGSIALEVYEPLHSLVYILVNYATLNIDAAIAPGEGPCEYFEIVKDDETTETRRYYVDRKKYQHISYFIFENSLGGFETARFTGRCVVGGEIQTTSLNKEYEINQKVQSGLRIVTSKKKQSSVVKNTGPLTKNDLAWINDFLLSTVVFELRRVPNGAIPGSQKWEKIPVIITTKDVPEINSQAFTSGFDIEYDYAFKDSYYTDKQYFGIE